ncbi:unnamed protein product [Adineta ricciae]|uniref:Uncharacterized protein n=1 Tax=Adineta ricciae TaxID=249248 RepID=A0A814TXX9_ADIRI|nr:unnamed protein product [Adineta ricciae]
MMKISLCILATLAFHLSIDHCQARSSFESKENRTDAMFFKKNRTSNHWADHLIRNRRQQDSFDTIDTASTVLSILPLDRLGTIVGQIMSTGLKEMLNPEVGKKLVNVIENQAPLLLTSLFTNLYSTLRVPVRPTSSNLTTSSISLNNNGLKQLSNTSASEIINAIRRPSTK